MEELLRKQLQITRFVYFALLAGQLIFLVFVAMVVGNRGSTSLEHLQGNSLFYLLPVLTFGSILGAYWVGAHRSKQSASIEAAEQKMNHLRETTLIQCAMVEGSNLYAIIVTMFSFSYLPLVFFGLGFLAFLLFYPTMNRWREAF